MFLVLLLLTLCLHAADCPWCLTRPGLVTCGGGGDMTAHPGFLPVAPAAGGGGKCGGTSPPPPRGLASGSGPPCRQGSIRPQPTRAPRYEAMALGPLWGRCAARAVARAPTRQWGGWRVDRGLSRRGTAAPPRTGCDRHGDRRPPPPPPGKQRSGGQSGDRHCLPGERQRRGVHQPLAPENPRPNLPASTRGTAAT